jgi:hypothetical protein
MTNRFSDLVGRGFGLAAELLLGAAYHKSHPNHADTPLVFSPSGFGHERPRQTRPRSVRNAG